MFPPRQLTQREQRMRIEASCLERGTYKPFAAGIAQKMLKNF